MRLMGVIGCTLWMSSCKQAPEAQTSVNYAIMKGIVYFLFGNDSRAAGY